MKKLLCVIYFIFFCSASLATQKKIFDVNFKDVLNSVRTLDLVFYSQLPEPVIIDKILRESLQHALLVDPNKDILATSFLRDEVLNPNQYSGMLVYEAKQKRILTIAEYQGRKFSVSNNSNYFVEVVEDKTFEGIKPERKWLSVTIVFAKRPSREEAYNSINAEVQKLSNKGLDMNLYVSVGNKNIKTTWKQMHDSDGTFVFASYDSINRRLTKNESLLKQYP